MRKRFFVAMLAALLATPLLAIPAAADYPDRTIRLLVPYPPGGPNDTIARLISSKIAVSLGTQVVVENRAGAAGNLAMEMTARAAPDGYTAVIPSVSYVTNPSLFKKISYNLEDVRPITVIAKGPTVLVASPSLGVRSVAELIALAKKKPGTIDYGSGGIGSTSHLSGEMLKHLAGIDIQHIPYKGTNDLMSDLLSGRVPLYFMSPLVARQQVSEGKVVALGITSPSRVQGWLDTPTMSETLLRGRDLASAGGAGVDPASHRRQAVEARHRCGEVEGGSERLRSLGFEPVGSSPKEAESYIAAETQRWLAIIKQANVTVE